MFSVISSGDLPVAINAKPRRTARQDDNERILQVVSRVNPRVVKCDLLPLRLSNIAKEVIQEVKSKRWIRREY